MIASCTHANRDQEVSQVFANGEWHDASVWQYCKDCMKVLQIKTYGPAFRATQLGQVRWKPAPTN